MKPRLTLPLLTALAACWNATAADPGNIVFVGDSITQGGAWNDTGAVSQPSYRYSFFKNMVDQGLDYRPMGIGTGSSTKKPPLVGELSYRGTTFENTHEAAASARTYTWSGIPQQNSGYNNNPGTRANEAPVWNLLGLTNPQTGSATTFYNNGALQTYTGQTYADKYGADVKPDTVCLMIGINDLIAVRNGTKVTREDGTKTAYTSQDVIANTHAIVEAYQQYNPGVDVVVMGLLPTAPGNGTYGMSGDYNALLSEAVKSWSTDTSSVRYADVSAGLSNTNHYDSGGAHPTNQGELVIAGNLAHALGVGQRTLGLQAKAVANFTHRLDPSSVSQSNFTVTPGGEWSTFSDADSGTHGLLLQADSASQASLTANAPTGWDVNAADGFTLQASIQMYAISGNALFLQFGDGTIGDGLLRVTESGVYWGSGNTLLYQGDQTAMNDFRITYMASGNAENVDAGYYVWRNNQLIGEALAAGATTNDALTLGSANGSLSYAGIADVSWENGAWSPADSSTIAASLASAALPSVSALAGDALVFNSSGSDLNAATAWGDGSRAPGSTDTIRFDSTCAVLSASLSAQLAVQGVEFETSAAMKITGSAANALAVGSGGITVSELAGNVFIQSVQLTDAQTWDIGQGKYLTIGSSDAHNGSLATEWSSGDHTVTVTGGGSVILDTVSAALQPIDWVVTGGSTIRSIWNTAGNANLGGIGSGSVTLDNGTLGVNFGTEAGGTANYGNWSWSNDIVVAAGGGTILQCAPTGDNRWLNLSGSISLAAGATADATLTFSREKTSLTVADRFGFILSGDNSAFTGKIVIDNATYLRVGADLTGLNPGVNGTLHAGVLENRGTLTFTHTDSLEVASSIAGAGVINVGSATNTTATPNQRITLSGDNASFTGAINVNQGTLALGSDTALGATSGVAIKAGGTLDLNGHDLNDGVVTLTFTSGSKVTNTSDTVSKLTVKGKGISGSNINVWTNGTVEAAAGKTIRLEVANNHTVFQGKFSGEGTVEKTVNGDASQRHFVVKSTGNTFSGTFKVSQGYLIFDPSTANAQTFAEGYRPDLDIAAGASVAVGNSFKTEANALKLGNLTGNGNFEGTYGTGPYFIDVQIDQEGATFGGQFTRTSNTRDYNLIKRGAATWTMTGASTAQGYLKVAEGQLNMEGSWIGATFVETGAQLNVAGAVGAANAARTHTIGQGATLQLTGNGELRNNGSIVSMREGSSEGLLGNVTVASTGISRTSAEGEGSIANATVTVKQTAAYTIENVRFDHSMLTLASAGSVTLEHVVLASGTVLDSGTAGGTMTLRNSTLELSSGNLTSNAGDKPVSLTQSLGGSLVEGSLTLEFAGELMKAIGKWEGGPYTNVTLTLTDVAGWASETDILFTGADTLFFQPLVDNVTVNIPSGADPGTVVVDISFGRPIPEPAAPTLGILGLGALLLRRRRRG